MPTYSHPGVYLEEIPSGSKPIEGVATSVAAFVGPAPRGPVSEAVLVHSFEDYTKSYGPIANESDVMGLAISAFYQNGGKTAYIARLAGAVSSAAAQATGQGAGVGDVIRLKALSPGSWGETIYYLIKKANASDLDFTLELGHLDESAEFEADEIFAGLDMIETSDNYMLKRVNGSSALVTASLLPDADPYDGANKYIKGSLTSSERVTGATVTKDTVASMAMTLNIDGLGARRITLGAAPADVAAAVDAVQAAVIELGPTNPAYKDFTCSYDGGSKLFQLTSGTRGSSSSVKVYAGEGGSTDLAELMKLGTGRELHGSSPVVAEAADGTTHEGLRLNGGVDSPPDDGDYQTFFNTKLIKVRDVSIIVLPGQSIPKDSSGNKAVDHALNHCEATGSRMVIIDPQADFELDDAGKIDQLALSTSTYGVLYFPWVRIGNPFYHPESAPNKNPTLDIAPSGFAAGVWSKVDGRHGVWKAPAGVEAVLLGTTGLQFDVGDCDKAQLNANGVNAIRALPGFGRVLWGSRTLSTRAEPEWRYVPVRRTAIFIEQSIYSSIQWAVFEPNTHILWSTLRVNIETFMNGLFRAGAFQGVTASEAFFVRCGLGDTMTQGDIDRGQVIVFVGFAPFKPTEFVILRLQQKIGQQ